jgi:hypothetical protein
METKYVQNGSIVFTQNHYCKPPSSVGEGRTWCGLPKWEEKKGTKKENDFLPKRRSL